MTVAELLASLPEQDREEMAHFLYGPYPMPDRHVENPSIRFRYVDSLYQLARSLVARDDGRNIYKYIGFYFVDACSRGCGMGFHNSG